MRCVRMPYDDCYHLVNNKRETKSKSKSKIHNNGFCCCIVTTRYVHCNRLQFCFGCKLEKPNPTENKTERQSCMDFCCDFFELIFSFLSLSLCFCVLCAHNMCVYVCMCTPVYRRRCRIYTLYVRIWKLQMQLRLLMQKICCIPLKSHWILSVCSWILPWTRSIWVKERWGERTRK